MDPDTKALYPFGPRDKAQRLSGKATPRSTNTMVLSALGGNLMSISKRLMDFLIGAPGLDFGISAITMPLAHCVWMRKQDSTDD